MRVSVLRTGQNGLLIVLRAGSFIVAVVTAFLSSSCMVPAIGGADAPAPNADAELEPVLDQVDAALEASDLKTAHDVLLPFADAGNHEAQFSIGLLILWDSEGQIFRVEQSEREHRAIAWIRRAAGRGNERAVRAMYGAYERGWYGLPKSGELEECWRRVVTFENGFAISDLTRAKACMDLDGVYFSEPR